MELRPTESLQFVFNEKECSALTRVAEAAGESEGCVALGSQWEWRPMALIHFLFLPFSFLQLQRGLCTALFSNPTTRAGATRTCPLRASPPMSPVMAAPPPFSPARTAAAPWPLTRIRPPSAFPPPSPKASRPHTRLWTPPPLAGASPGTRSIPAARATPWAPRPKFAQTAETFQSRNAETLPAAETLSLGTGAQAETETPTIPATEVETRIHPTSPRRIRIPLKETVAPSGMTVQRKVTAPPGGEMQTDGKRSLVTPKRTTLSLSQNQNPTMNQTAIK